MKIIKKSETINEICSKVRFSCPVCNSRLEEHKRYLQPVMLLDELHYGFICPACGGKVAVKECDLESMRRA